jgi:hypothetical protein
MGSTPQLKATAKWLNSEVSMALGNIDIWKLRLDGTGSDFVRLTRFNDYEGWKASNPVITTDGKMMAFQVAHTSDRAGVGYGIVLYRF